MMATGLFSSTRNSGFLLMYKLTTLHKNAVSAPIKNMVRQLFSPAALGVDGYIATREKVSGQMSNISEKFREKMAEYSEDNNSNMVFSEDLKNMIHLAKNENDLGTVVKMIKKFNQQNKELRFGTFVFGPVVMRLFYHFNTPDIALECFRSPELAKFFDQTVSYQILLDLLYENQRYQDVLDAFEVMKDNQMEGAKYPKNLIVLVLAACYKLNSKESLDYALKLWKELQNVGHQFMRRAVTFCAALTLKQGEPAIALEILTSAKHQNYTTVRNLKVAALAEIGRVEFALPVFKSVFEDFPSDRKATFNKEVMVNFKVALTKLDNPELALEFNRIEQSLIKGGHITDMTLDEQLCQEIQKTLFTARQDRLQRPYRRDGPERGPNKFYTHTQSRPGLGELY